MSTTSTILLLRALQAPLSGSSAAERLPFSLPGLPPEGVAKVLISLAVILGLVLVRRAVLRVVDRRVEEAAARYRWSKVTGYVAFLVGAVAILQVWFTALQSLGTFLGLVSAGLAIALKDLVADLAGWFFIVWRRPFDVGDRIEIGGHAGDVVDLRIFQFTILEVGNWVGADQSTGRLIHIPNASVFTQPLANYTATFAYIWNELPVTVTFESDWRKAKGLLKDIVEERFGDLAKEARASLRSTSQRFLIHYRNLTPIVFTSVADSGVVLTVRYLSEPRKRRSTAQELWELILDAFAQAEDIDLAYPTQRVYVNPLEGKPGARAEWPEAGGGRNG